MPRPLHIAVMRQVIPIEGGGHILNMGLITAQPEFSNFAGLSSYILDTLRYPRPHASKEESYGWTATWFDLSTRTRTDRRSGLEVTRVNRWRREAGEIDLMSVWVGDVDNKDDTRPHVTIEAVARSLLDIGLAAFLYTSFTHSAERHKFRVVIETDRDMTRDEARHLYVYLDEHVFGGQADPAIYDPADFLFGPPFRTSVVEVEGAPMPVDALLAEPCDVARLRDLRAARERACRPRSEATPEQRALLHDTSLRAAVSISNPRICRPEWIAEYAASTSGHWQTMRSVMGRMWLKSGGSLSRGEMEHLLAELDGHCNGYFLTHHGQPKASEIVSFVMRQGCTPLAPPQHPFDKHPP